MLQYERAPCIGREESPGGPPPIIVSSYRYDIIEAQRIVVVVASYVLEDVHAAQRRIPPHRSEQAGAPRLRRRQQLPPPAEQVNVARPFHRFDGVDAAFELEVVHVTSARDRAIFGAIPANASEAMRLVSDEHVGVNARDAHGSTPLMLAINHRVPQLVATLRTLIAEDNYPELGKALEGISDAAQRRLDEVGMAWQEFLCWELERASKPPSDQVALKSALARATAVGMLPVEKPVHKALAVFIDPPEFVADLSAT